MQQKDSKPSSSESRTVLSTRKAIVILLLAGVVAIVLGFGLAPLVAVVGAYSAETGGKFTGVGGALWLLLSPCVPYLLLGCSLGLTARHSSKKDAGPLMRTAVILGLLIVVVHLVLIHQYSSTIAESRFDDLAIHPLGWVTAYFVVGTWGMMMIAGRIAVSIDRRLTFRSARLEEASRRGDLDELNEILAERKAAVDHSALRAAAEGGHFEVIRALLEAGADVKAKVPNGWTALIVACEKGHLESVKALLSAGADVNGKTSFGAHDPVAFRRSGYTPLIMASENGHTDVVQELLARGAEIGAKSKIGWTALVAACEKGHLDTVMTLLSAGSDVNAITIYNLTPLGYASAAGHVEVVRVLLGPNADVNFRNKRGTVLDMAKKAGHTAVENLLIQAGARQG